MTARRLLVAVVLAALTGGCGVPTGGAPTTIEPSDIPYGLTSPSTAPPATLSEPVADPARVYLVAPDDSLVPRPRDISGDTRQERLADLLEHLAAGPTGVERDEQLSTALPPDVELSVTEVSVGIATIDIAGVVDAPSGWATRRTVGQLVLTATSLPGIDSVRLTLSGEPVEAPLPDGELTSDPLTAEDYAVFLTPPSPQPAVPSPLPPFPADASADQADPSSDALLTLRNIRIGRHQGYDRVVFELGGTGSPGWDVRYVDEPRSQGSGEPVEVAGPVALQVSITGVGYPGDTGVEEYSGPDRLPAAATEVVTEVVLDVTFEGMTSAFIGTTRQAPFRVYRLQDPARVVVEVVAPR